MTNLALTKEHPTEDELRTFLLTIASGDVRSTLRTLAEHPSLATRVVESGATQDEARAYYLERLSRYVYAGDSALHVAAAARERDVALDLLRRGANVRARNRRGAEPLHYATDGLPNAAAFNQDAQFAMVELLIRSGANPNSADTSGVAPLHRAVRARSTAAVRALLENGADPLVRNQNGSTPLHLAVEDPRAGTLSPEARDAQRDIILLLLEHGARSTHKDAAGKTVKQCAGADWVHALLAGR
jgi:ankyrin repeat protein